MNRNYIISPSVLCCLASGGVKHYIPPAINSENHFLMVEGVINTNDSTIIKLSRSVNLASDTNYLPELKAVVSIQDNQNQSYVLKELGNGIYSSAVLNLDNTHQYRLNNTTTDDKNYQSDYVPAMVTPAIDSIGGAIESNGLQIYINTHDPKNSTHYYRWDYKETWILHAEYYPGYITNDSTNCQQDTALYYNAKTYDNDVFMHLVYPGGSQVTTSALYGNGPSPIGYLYSDPDCADCSIEELLLNQVFGSKSMG